MKTIIGPGGIGTFTLTVNTDNGLDGITLIDAYDTDDKPVVSVAVYSDGSVEFEWCSDARPYRDRDDKWWNDLLDAAVAAVTA